jgi:AcrR family transcriptional regulator
MDELPPTARRLLAAARRLLAEGGFGALSLQAIAREAGESKGSVSYYFRNKQGLVVALVDSLVHDANRALLTETARLPVGGRRIHALVEGEQRISADVQAFTGFFEVLPHALRDPSLRPRVAGLYESYRQTVMMCLGADARAGASVAAGASVGAGAGTGAGAEAVAGSRLLPLAALMIAVVDGLSIQVGLDPDGFDVEVPFRTWEAMLAAYLRSEA